MSDNNISILSFDTSTDLCSATLKVDLKMYTREAVSKNQHTKIILPMIKDILTEANFVMRDLNLIAFANGPGSFTGVRIATALGQGLSFGNNIKLSVVSTLKVIALSAYNKFGYNLVLSTLDAMMDEIYWGLYKIIDNRTIETIISDKISNFEDLQQELDKNNINNFLIAGTAVEKYHGQFSKSYTNTPLEFLYPTSEYICELAEQNYKDGNIYESNDLQVLPLYIRNNVVS